MLLLGASIAVAALIEAFVLGIIGWLVALLIAIAAIVIALLLGAYVGRSSNGHRHAIDTDTAQGPP